jgi:uncharacterized lipoprotein
VLAALCLVACASDNSRYHDNANLERPPEVPINKQAAEQTTANELEAPKRRHGKGLKSDVYMVEGSSAALQIKRGFDESWSLLHQAIQHHELKITDQDRSKGFYYIAYHGGGLLSGATSLFGDSSNLPTYLLKVEPQGEETRVTASLANKNEQVESGNLKAGASNNSSEDKSEKLLELLYDTLHDVVKSE